MLEQKLFFTRNGQYTIWEKINSVEDDNLDLIIKYIIEVLGIDLQQESYMNSSRERLIYTVYKLNQNINEKLENEIQKYSLVESIEKSDFNAVLYKLDLSYMNIDLVYSKLERLQEKDSEYDLDNIKSTVFFRKNEKCIDIRLSSTKINDYKDNSNEQFINTEIRIYFELGLMLMTDYNEYTHNRTVKAKLLENLNMLLNNNYQKIESYKLSDITLRFLLKKSRKYASKFKFYVDEYINVDFNVVDSIGDNPLEHAGLREFYDKHQISAIKILMNSNEEKYITVDGEKGKLISRSKNMEVKDIDEFVKLLSDVIKYDYLNVDYKKNIKDIAVRKLIGHTAYKLAQVEDIYTGIENKIAEYLNNKKDIETIVLTRNTFLYCLINNKSIDSSDTITYKLDKGIIQQLCKLLNIQKESIAKVFNHIVTLTITNNDNLLEALDEFINLKGDLNVNQV